LKAKIGKIYLSWRKGRGSRRKIIGVLERNASNGITFRYFADGVKEALEEGFKEYPGFPIPKNFDIVYKESDLDIFSLRLIPFERKDNSGLLRFWEAENVTDKFDLLAYTQGILPTDNFEFLGLFNPTKHFKFVTDIAGLTHLNLKANNVSIGDELNYEIEPNLHSFRKKAVKVFKFNTHVGYIKNIHNNIFLKTNRKIKLKVKEIEQNGIIKNIFVLIDSTYSTTQ